MVRLETDRIRATSSLVSGWSGEFMLPFPLLGIRYSVNFWLYAKQREIFIRHRVFCSNPAPIVPKNGVVCCVLFRALARQDVDF